MPTLVTIHTTNASTNAPIIGARIFVDGSASVDGASPVVTGSDGSGQVNLVNSGVRTIQVTATGFDSQQFTVTVTNASQAAQQNLQLALTAGGSAPFNLQFIPRVAGITWSIGSPPIVVTNGVSIADGSSGSPVAATFDTYTLIANLNGYQTLTTPLILNGQTTPYTFTLIANSDPNSAQQGNTNGNSANGTTAATTSASISNPPDQAEFIYPNTDYDKYFTIVGARMYIGNLFIDELSSVQYALQDNAIPVYGYASRFADAYGQGRSLVQGQLTLNFVTEGYLFTVLQQYQQLLGQGANQFPIGSPQADVVAQVLALMATRDKLNQLANNSPNTDSQAAVNGNSPTQQAALLQTQITQLTAGMSSDQVAKLSSLRTQQLKTFSDPVGFDNAIYQDILFDIRLEFGNEVTGVKRLRYLEKCKLISNEQVIAPDGQTIMDSYGFIARRLR